ncbi:metal-dependent hydrolase [Anatilimnocola sp. NA78]|uniref:metal-dependent hydrolase n=1 Tax=Anatilimnocola sp. NA78 TaxID=3415683 RepID=UPI003CE47B55
MADFKSHITFSTALGAVYGVAGYFYLGLPIETSILGGTLCSVSGMLPDLDSDSGTPVRETSTFAAAVIPMLMMPRFEALHWSREMMVLAAAITYAVIRFGVVEIFKKYTVHRGMWHSIPACIVCGLLTFMIVADLDLQLRLFKSGAVMLGFFSHLLLDEIWSLNVRSLNVKKSFGTAIKFFGKDSWANYSVYGKLLALSFLAVGDPMLMDHFGHHVYFGNPHALQASQQLNNKMQNVQQRFAPGTQPEMQQQPVYEQVPPQFDPVAQQQALEQARLREQYYQQQQYQQMQR